MVGAIMGVVSWAMPPSTTMDARFQGAAGGICMAFPNPRVRRWDAREPQAGELRQAACQHAIVADGHEPRHGHP